MNVVQCLKCKKFISKKGEKYYYIYERIKGSHDTTGVPYCKKCFEAMAND